MKEYLEYSRRSTPLCRSSPVCSPRICSSRVYSPKCAFPIYAPPVCTPPYGLSLCIILRLLSQWVYSFMCALFRTYSWVYTLSPLCGQDSSIYALFCVYSSHLCSPRVYTSLCVLSSVYTPPCVLSPCGLSSVYILYIVYSSFPTSTLPYVYSFLYILFFVCILLCV